MARREWVSVEVEPGVWRRLVVFDDGWVELPGPTQVGRGGRQRDVVAGVLLLTLLGAPLLGFGAGLTIVDIARPVAVALLVLGVVVVGYALFLLGRNLLGDVRRARDEVRRARVDRAAGQSVRRRPGAPLLRRPTSARELASWIEGGVHVDAADVVGVDVLPATQPARVDVRLADGTTRSYASPDVTLPRLLTPFAPR